MRSAKYYDILEISPHASDAAIRAAYRSLSRKYHPDTNPDAEGIQHFKLIQEAREILTDPVKRAKYDQQLANAGRCVSSLVNVDLDRVKYDSGSQFPGGRSVSEAAVPAEMNSTKHSAWKNKLRAGKLWKTGASTAVIIGTGLLCSLFIVVVWVVRTLNIPERISGVAPSDSHGLVMALPVRA